MTGLDEFMVFEEEDPWEPSNRLYAPLPLEYYKEMRHLSAEDFGKLMRILLYFNVTGKVPPVEGVLCHYVDRVIDTQKRFSRNWDEASKRRSIAGKKAAKLRWEKAEQDDAIAQNAMRTHAIACDSCHTESNSKSESDSDSDSESESDSESKSNPSLREAVGYRTEIQGDRFGNGAPAAPMRGRVDMGMNPETPVADAMVRLLGIRPSQSCLSELRAFVNRLGRDTCMFAVERAADEGRCSWSYVRGILRDLERQGIQSRTVAEVGHRSHGKKRDNHSMYFSHSHPQTQLSEWEKQAMAEALTEEI